MNTQLKLLSTALFSVALMGAMPASAGDHGEGHMSDKSEVHQGQEGADKTERLPTQRGAGDKVEAGTVGSDGMGETGAAGKRPDATVDGPDGVNGGGATAE